MTADLLNHGVGLVVAAEAPLVSIFAALITYVTITVAAVCDRDWPYNVVTLAAQNCRPDN